MITILTNTYQMYEPPAPPSGIVELDMGCGKGGYTLALAERYPDRLILGSDVMLGRLRRIERKIERRGLRNAQLLRAASLQLVSFQLPPQCVDRIHLLCPDPWPKDKHQVKRLVTSDFLCRLPRILKVGGILHASTDHAPYFEEWLRLIGHLDLFEFVFGVVDDMADVKTEFERLWNGQGKEVQHACWRLVRTW